MFDDDDERSAPFRQLRTSLQALAVVGAEQRALFPEFATTPNELAAHFDHWLSAVREHDPGELSDVQADALGALERKLATMSRDGAEFDADLWTDAAVADSPHWEEVRRLAAAALTAFDGADEPSTVSPDRESEVRDPQLRAVRQS